MLYNLQICDINYFDAYVCEFERYYYQVEVAASIQTSLNFHNDMFFTKLPYPWCDVIFSKWKESDCPERTDTLGGRIEFARMTLAHECEKAYKRRRLQKDHKKLRCKDQLYYPSKFGCDVKPRKPKKKFKAKKWKGKKLKKKAKTDKPTQPFKKKRKFFKKKKNDTVKPSTKQVQKQDCRCWNCNEKGHFANECPKQINFAGVHTHELYEPFGGYAEVPWTDIESEDDILVLTYLSSSSSDESSS